MPSSPITETSPPWPPSVAAHISSSRATSAARPTNALPATSSAAGIATTGRSPPAPRRSLRSSWSRIALSSSRSADPGSIPSSSASVVRGALVRAQGVGLPAGG